MKISIEATNKKELLELADEIVLPQESAALIPDLARESDVDIVLQCQNLKTILEDIDKYKDLAKGRLKIEIRQADAEILKLIKEKGVKVFFGYPIVSFATLKELIDMGVDEVYIGRPLTFLIDKVKRFNVPVRVNPLAASGYKAACSDYIRPEDVDLFDPCTLLFSGRESIGKIKAYKNKNWPGNLDLLIPELPTGINNRLIPDKFQERYNCGQHCMESPLPDCHLCETSLHMGTLQKELKKLKDEKEKPVEK